MRSARRAASSNTTASSAGPDPTGFALNAFGSGIEQINFFGTRQRDGQGPRSGYRSQQTVFSLTPAVRAGSSALSLTVGPELLYSNSGDEPGTVLAEQSPYGTGGFNRMALRASIEADTRPQDPRVAVRRGDRHDRPARARTRLPAAACASSARPSSRRRLWTSDQLRRDRRVGRRLCGHLECPAGGRVGGARLFGDYPWFDAAFLGGRTDRGFRSHRYAGDASLYGNVELRTYLGPPVFASIFPVRFGLVGFVDDGRVWVSGEDSQRWHPSAGGGVLLKPVGTTIVLRASRRARHRRHALLCWLRVPLLIPGQAHRDVHSNYSAGADRRVRMQHMPISNSRRRVSRRMGGRSRRPAPPLSLPRCHFSPRRACRPPVRPRAPTSRRSRRSPRSRPRSEAKTFVLPPGYRMELVLADPDVDTPAGDRVRRQRPDVRRRVRDLHARRRGHRPARAAQPHQPLGETPRATASTTSARSSPTS